MHELMAMNDNGVPFADIAQWVEDYLRITDNGDRQTEESAARGNEAIGGSRRDPR
jgi:hypothetical protein